jgi:hypothetical protein
MNPMSRKVFINYAPRKAVWGSGQLHSPAAFFPGEVPPPQTHWIGDSVEPPKASLDTMEKRNLLLLPGIELWPSSPLPCRLDYPGSRKCFPAEPSWGTPTV